MQMYIQRAKKKMKWQQDYKVLQRTLNSLILIWIIFRVKKVPIRCDVISMVHGNGKYNMIVLLCIVMFYQHRPAMKKKKVNNDEYNEHTYKLNK